MLVETFRRTNERDTGSPEVQIALFSERINYLTYHLWRFPKDVHTAKALHQIKMKRDKMLKYLRRIDGLRYVTVLRELDIRGLPEKGEEEAAN